MKTTRSGRRIVAGLALLAAAATGRAEPQDAQAASPIVVGSRVRVQAGSLRKAVDGTVVEMDDRILIVSQDRRPVRVTRNDITRLEVSTGRRGQARKGLAIGAAIGAAAFAAIPREEYCADYGPEDSCPSRAGMIGTGVLGGALWGVLIGHFVKTERWSPVALDRAQVRVAPSRARGGVGLAVSVAW